MEFTLAVSDLRKLIKHEDGIVSSLSTRQQRDLLKAVCARTGLPFEFISRVAVMGPQRGLTRELAEQITAAVAAVATAQPE